MAIDEAIMSAVGSGLQPPTLRLYAWDPPALSLGYSQPISDARKPALKALGWGIVRRPTGGRAILHTDELTYSFCAPVGGRYFQGGVLPSYRRLSRGLARGLRLLGLAVEARPAAVSPSFDNPVCFEVPSAFELIVSGRKICGSAQVRRREAALQHGTVPLYGDLSRIVRVLNFATSDQASYAQARLDASAGTISGLLGQKVSWDQVADALTEGFTQALEIDLLEADLSSAELGNLEELIAKHRSRKWLERV